MADDLKEKESDMVLLHSRTEDGEGFRALRSRKKKIEVAELRPLKEGKLMGSAEVVRLQPRQENPLLFNVMVEYAPPQQSSPSHAGPPRVANNAYRHNWEAIFDSPHTNNTNELLEPGPSSNKRLLN